MELLWGHFDVVGIHLGSLWATLASLWCDSAVTLASLLACKVALGRFEATLWHMAVTLGNFRVIRGSL